MTHERQIPLAGRFEIKAEQEAILCIVDSTIFPIGVLQRAARRFLEKTWIAIDGDSQEILVELKPKTPCDLELLAKQFNEALLESADLNIDLANEGLIAAIKGAAIQFINEQQGKISKRSVLIIGFLLAGVGISSLQTPNAGASHLCPGEGACSGEGYEGCGGCEGEDADGGDSDGDGEGAEGAEGGEGEGGCEGCGCGEGF